MKAFIVKILFLGLPPFLVCYYLESQLGKVYNSFNFRRENLESRLDSIEVLVLGSSQAVEGINPAVFSRKGFNLANVSQSLFYDTRLTLKYIDKMPRLEYVLITISYFSLGYQVHDGIESWKDEFYSQFWGIDFPELSRFDLKRYSRVALYSPVQSLSYIMHGFKRNLIRGISRDGYLRIDTTNYRNSISDSLGRVRVRFHDKMFNTGRVQENIEDLDHLVNELRKRNIIPVIVTAPVFSTYSKFADQGKLRLNDSVITSICSKYGCRYFNYFTDKRFEKKDYLDNDHLNFVGADKFSRIINEDILKN